MGRLKAWVVNIKIGLAIVGAAFAILWFTVRRAYTKGVATGETVRGAKDDLKEVSCAEKARDGEAIKRDIFRRIK